MELDRIVRTFTFTNDDFDITANSLEDFKEKLCRAVDHKTVNGVGHYLAKSFLENVSITGEWNYAGDEYEVVVVGYKEKSEADIAIDNKVKEKAALLEEEEQRALYERLKKRFE